MKIEVKYNGAYPNLCSGHLVVIVDGKEYDFGRHCLTSGGSVWFDEGWCEHVEDGPWEVEFPKDFPDELKDAVTDEINDHIGWGCCGGCV